MLDTEEKQYSLLSDTVDHADTFKTEFLKQNVMLLSEEKLNYYLNDPTIYVHVEIVVCSINPSGMSL